MAPGPPVIAVDPPGTPPAPAFVDRDIGDGNSPIDDDGLVDLDKAQLDSKPTTLSPTLTSSTRRPSISTYLRPETTSLLKPPSPETPFIMSSEDNNASGSGSGGGATGTSPPKNPFNFKTQYISTAPIKTGIGQRRGHRYKHSSISASHSFFQEPPPRPPPVLPASLPIPTLKEAWASMQPVQRARLYWCICHAVIAMYVLLSAEGSLAMTALSHLVFFDVGSAVICVVVDVLGNFEVWRRSSIRHPFGLQRAEVLAGFAMSIFLVFGGFDLISHNVKHLLEGVGEHSSHHPLPNDHDHSHGHHHGPARYISPGTVDFACLAAIISTLVNAHALRNHGRVRRIMRVPFPYLASILPGAGILANPFHFLTLCFAFLMLLLPLVSVPQFVWLDRFICAAITGSMFLLGVRLAIAQGLMLLMSYDGSRMTANPNATSYVPSPAASGPGEKKKIDSGAYSRYNDGDSVSAVLREIEADVQVARVEEAQFWQVHYGLGMANLKVKVARSYGNGTGTGVSLGSANGASGGDDNGASLSQLRSRLARIVQNRLGEGYGRGGSLRWEVTVQTSSSEG